MAQTKDPQSGGSAKAKKKTGAKKAKKAIARAEKSVAEARVAVRALDKRLRKRVSKLAKQTARLSAERDRKLRKKGSPPATPVPEAEGPEAVRAADTASADDADTGLTPPLPAPQPPAATMIELRQRARDHKIPGYSRMSKSDLSAALEAAQQR